MIIIMPLNSTSISLSLSLSLSLRLQKTTNNAMQLVPQSAVRCLYVCFAVVVHYLVEQIKPDTYSRICRSLNIFIF